MAKGLKDRGCELTFAARTLGDSLRMLSEFGRLYQAPVRLKEGRNPVRTQVSYASLLHNTGLDDPEEYAGRIASWRHLMQDSKAHPVFADHSQAARIAAGPPNLPVSLAGPRFTVPPVRPLAYFRPVIDERRNQPLPDGYLAYLRLKLHNVAARLPAPVQKNTLSRDR